MFSDLRLPVEVVDMILTSLLDQVHSFDLIEVLSVMEPRFLMSRLEMFYTHRNYDYVLHSIVRNMITQVEIFLMNRVRQDSDMLVTAEQILRRSGSCLREKDGFCYLSLFDDLVAVVARRILGPHPRLRHVLKFLLAVCSISVYDQSDTHQLYECVFQNSRPGELHCQRISPNPIPMGDFVIKDGFLLFLRSDRFTNFERSMLFDVVNRDMGNRGFGRDMRCGSSVGGLFATVESVGGSRSGDKSDMDEIESFDFNFEEASTVRALRVQPKESTITPSESASRNVSSSISVSQLLAMYKDLHEETNSLRSELATMSGCKERLRDLWVNRDELDVDLEDALNESGTHCSGEERIVDSPPKVSGSSLVMNHTMDKRLNFLISLHVTLYEVFSEDGVYPCQNFMERMMSLLSDKDIWERYDSQYLDLLLIVLTDTFDLTRSRVRNNRFCLPGLESNMRLTEGLIGNCLTSLSDEYKTRWKNLFKDLKLPLFVLNNDWGDTTVKVKSGKTKMLNWKRVNYENRWKSVDEVFTGRNRSESVDKNAENDGRSLRSVTNSEVATRVVDKRKSHGSRKHREVGECLKR